MFVVPLTATRSPPDQKMERRGSGDARTTTYRQRALIQLKDAVVTLAFSADGSWLACGSRRGECCIVNVALGKVHRSLWNSPFGSTAGIDNRYSDWRATDTIAAFDPTRGSARLATAPCGTCAGINIVDVETGSVRAHMGGKMGELMRMQDVAFSPDGTLVLGVSETPPRPLRNAVCIWRADTGADRFKLTGHTENVRRACFSPCGRYIASAAADRTVRVWRTGGRWPCVATLSEHGEAVEHVAFSQDGRTLSSGARDGRSSSDGCAISFLWTRKDGNFIAGRRDSATLPDNCAGMPSAVGEMDSEKLTKDLGTAQVNVGCGFLGRPLNFFPSTRISLPGLNGNHRLPSLTFAVIARLPLLGVELSNPPHKDKHCALL
uniref:Uncharacterized protein n=1 Tax=Ganoderma boninense TaxID=34458 RepID=A0A5K1K1X3_9APHY|nr:Uncharacterized protein [Ganoderma boninense]